MYVLSSDITFGGIAGKVHRLHSFCDALGTIFPEVGKHPLPGLVARISSASSTESAKNNQATPMAKAQTIRKNWKLKCSCTPMPETNGRTFACQPNDKKEDRVKKKNS